MASARRDRTERVVAVVTLEVVGCFVYDHVAGQRTVGRKRRFTHGALVVAATQMRLQVGLEYAGRYEALVTVATHEWLLSCRKGGVY